MSTYEIFDLLSGDFKDKFDGNDIVFPKTYAVGQQQIRVCHLKHSSKIDVVEALEFLNQLQEKYLYHHYWSSFFKDI